MAAELEVSLDLVLNRRQAQIGEPCRLEARELLVMKVDQRLTAKECEPLSESLQARDWTVSSRDCDQPLKRRISSSSPSANSRR